MCLFQARAIYKDRLSRFFYHQIKNGNNDIKILTFKTYATVTKKPKNKIDE